MEAWPNHHCHLDRRAVRRDLVSQGRSRESSWSDTAALDVPKAVGCRRRCPCYTMLASKWGTNTQAKPALSLIAWEPRPLRNAKLRGSLHEPFSLDTVSPLEVPSRDCAVDVWNGRVRNVALGQQAKSPAAALFSAVVGRSATLGTREEHD